MSGFVSMLVVAFFWSYFLFWLFERIKRRKAKKRERAESERQNQDFEELMRKIQANAREMPPEIENHAIKQMALSHLHMIDGLCRKIGWSSDEFMEELLVSARQGLETFHAKTDEYTEEKMVQKLREDLEGK